MAEILRCPKCRSTDVLPIEHEPGYVVQWCVCRDCHESFIDEEPA